MVSKRLLTRMSRPKRESAQRAASQTSVLFWNEERDLKKALHASLVEARRKARIAIKEKERVKEQEKHKEKKSNHCDVTVTNKVKSKSHKLKKAELPVASLTTFSSTIITKENSKVCALEDNDNGMNILKKARIPAQRKFAQGSSNNTPISSPIKVSYCVPTVTQEMFTKVKPTAADFLTFLCLRDTSILPERLDLEALNKELESEPQLDINDVRESSDFKSPVDSNNSIESPIKNVPQEASEESNQYSKKTLMNKIAALKVKYKLQRMAKKSTTSANVVKVKEASSINSVSSLSTDEKPLKKMSDNETSKSKKINSSLSKLNVAKSNITSTTTQRVLRSHHNPSEEGAFKLSLPSINCLCKSESPPKPALKKFKRSVNSVITSRPLERKAKPTGLIDCHLEIDDGSDLEHTSRGREYKLFTSRDRESQPAKSTVVQKSSKKDTKDGSSSLTNTKNVLSERILRNRHCLVQNTSHAKSPSKAANKCQIKCNSLTNKRTKGSSSPERRPNRKAKPNAPLIDYHIEIEGESDVEMKKSLKEKEHKQKVDTKTLSAVKKFEVLKNPSVVLTRTQIPMLKQQVKTCVKEQGISKRTVAMKKSKLVPAPEKRVTRSLSNASKKDEDAAKEREKEIKKKILEVEKRQKQRMARHASESSLHSSSSSDSLTSSISSSSSINIPRITRSLEQLKKLRKELKKNKQKMLNGSLLKKSSTEEKSTVKKKFVSRTKKIVEMRSFAEKSTSTPKSKVKLVRQKSGKKEPKVNVVNLKSRRRKCAQHQTSGEDITKALQTMAEGLNSSDDHCVPDFAYCDSAPIQGLMTREFSGAFAEETVSTASAMLLPSSSACSFAQTCSHIYAQTSDANQKATVDASTNTTEEEILALSINVSDTEKNCQCPMEELSVGTQTVTPVGSPESETCEELRVSEPVVERCSRSKSGRNGLKL